MAVDRCVCMDVTFRELLALHEKERLELDELKRQTGASQACTFCEPYIKRTLRTKETEHPVLSPAEEGSE